jgi:hypothetical protein
MKYMNQVQEYATVVQNRLSRDSEVYHRVYDLLEEHTQTWVTDAWKKNPSRDAIRELPLKELTEAQALAIAGKHHLSPEKALDCVRRRRSQVLLEVNDQQVVVERSIYQLLVNALKAHEHQAG